MFQKNSILVVDPCIRRDDIVGGDIALTSNLFTELCREGKLESANIETQRRRRNIITPINFVIPANAGIS
jgi:hypothetical protein